MDQSIEGFNLDISFLDVKKTIQESLVEQGKMKPYALQKLIDKLELQAENSSEALSIVLKQGWNRYFPGVEFSEELLFQEVSKIMQSRISEKIEEFSNQLKEESIHIVLGKYIASSEQNKFLMMSLASLFTFPLSFWLITVKVDMIPILGILLLLSTVGGLAWTTINTLKKS